jgi:hypothetical protein
MPSLRELSFAETKLRSEQEWQAMGMLSTLEHLELFYLRSGITDAHIAHLSGLHRLKYLSISSDEGYGSSDITDKALAHISKLKALEHLSLSGAKITEQGLQQFAELPALRHITFENCEVSEDSLQRLKEKLPALRWSIY